MIPIYQDHHAHKGENANAGLWFERFFDYGHSNSWKVEADTKSRFLTDLLQTHKLAGSREQIEQHAFRQCGLVQALGGNVMAMRAEWHFASGLGNPHPLENGLIWHPTLATPYLPGSAVKGLARAWLEQHDYNPELRRRLFGTSTKEPDGSTFDSGEIIFFDALPLERVALVQDVMTPHMGDWYAKGDTEPGKNSTTPADWHNPVPVQFLACKSIRLMFSVAPRTPNSGELLPLAKAALKAALEHLGAGAKTAAGYGAFLEDAEKQSILDNKMAQEKAEQERQSLSEEQKILAGLKAKAEDPQLAGASNGAAFHNELEDLLQTSQSWPDADRKQLLDLAQAVFKQHGSKKKFKARRDLINAAEAQLKG